MTKFFKTFLILSFIAALLMTSGPLWAQTGDDIVPAIEDVCDGDPFSFGLCNAYCEALDCDDPTPIGSPRACDRVLNNYMKKSDGLAPPCEAECPCVFDLEGDLNILAAQFSAGDEIIDVDPQSANYRYDFCVDIIENDGNIEDTHITQAFADDPYVGSDTPKGIRLLYAVEGTQCSEIGGDLDGYQGVPNDWYEFSSIGDPFINNTETGLSPGQVQACNASLADLCSVAGPIPPDPD